MEIFMINISVVITTYNAELYILDTLRSVSNQSYKNIEIIIFDDGSIDNTTTLISHFINQNMHIKIHLQKNNHVGRAIASPEWCRGTGANHTRRHWAASSVELPGLGPGGKFASELTQHGESNHANGRREAHPSTRSCRRPGRRRAISGEPSARLPGPAGSPAVHRIGSRRSDD